MSGNIRRRLAVVVFVPGILLVSVFSAGCLSDGSKTPITNHHGTAQNPLNITTAAQLGDNSSKIIAIAAGQTHNLALRHNGTVIAWARGLSCSYVGECDIPGDLTNITAIGAGEGYSAALTKEGNVIVWGCKWGPVPRHLYSPYSGYYNNCEENCTCRVPANLTNVKAISAGRRHILALKEDGTVVAWGENHYGQCNVPVKFIKNVTAVSAGGYMSMALRDDGFVYTWGNYRGRVPPGTYSGIASGYDYGLLLTDNGSVRAFSGATDFETPYEAVYVPDLKNVTALSGYDRYFLALLDNGTVVYWAKSNSSTIFKKWENITGLHNVTAISSQSMNNLALKDDGTVLNWELFSSDVSVRKF